MKQSIVEVIVYLMEAATSQAEDIEDSFADQAIVKQKLEEAGFARDVVASTFDWLRELIEQQCWYATSLNVNARTAENKTIRIFNPEESARINLEVRNFILSLEFNGILDTKMREIVITQLMQLNQRLVEITDAKWVVLLVLMSKANRNIHDIRGYLLATMALET